MTDMSYGYFHFGPESDQAKQPFPMNRDKAYAIAKCLKTADGDFWIFTVNDVISVSATIKEGGAFVILNGGESVRGIFTAAERHWDDEFRQSFVCWTNNPRTRWVVGINAYDMEGQEEFPSEGNLIPRR